MGQQGDGSVDAYVGSLPPDDEPPALDGEVTSSAEILTVASNAANAGKSYYMRGGSYGAMNLTSSHRPASAITFITYPGEQVLFTDVDIDGARNLTFDGNESNRTRAAAGGFADGTYGLWFQGSGITGYDIPAVNNVLTIQGSNGSTLCENVTIKNFRVGDAASSDESNWRCQHGIVLGPLIEGLLFEDGEVAYIATDLRDQVPADGDGDVAGGGFGIQYFGSDDSGNQTFRRVHFHHTMNDFCQYGPNGSTGEVRFEECLFEELTNFGDAHADMLQVFGTFGASGELALTYEGCVFRNGTDYMLHGDKPGSVKTFTNCLFGDPAGAFPNVNNITLSKTDEGGLAYQIVFEDCSMEYANNVRLDSTAGASYAPSPKHKIRNSIYPGFSTDTSVNRNNAFENDGEPNVVTDGGTGVTGDVTASPAPTYNSQGECTNYSQGWRKPATFPWTL